MALIDVQIVVITDYIAAITAVYGMDSETYETSGILSDIVNAVHKALDFETYIKAAPNDETSGTFDGEGLWHTCCSYIREDKYTNQNIISDGLTNAELVAKALELFDSANQELSKAGTLQYSLSTTMNNLLVLPEFKPFIDNFAVGNWIHVGMDDKIYKLRLLSYQISYDDMQTIQVEFSTAEKISTGITGIKSILDSAQSMASSYDGMKALTKSNAQKTNYVTDFVNNGITLTEQKIITDANNQTIVIDEHGILCQSKNDTDDTYDPCQTKIIGNSIFVTEDNWNKTKNALGKFSYITTDGNNQLVTKTAYGLLAESIVGKFILGEQLSIQNSTGKLLFDKNGFRVTNDKNTITIHPGTDTPDGTESSPAELFKITNSENKTVFCTDSDGNLKMTGSAYITGGELNIGDNFSVSEDGVLTASSAHITGGNLNIGNNFSVSEDGVLTASSAHIEGIITSDEGRIGGFTIKGSALYDGTTSISSTTPGIYIGPDGIRQYKDNHCYVQIQNGKLSCIGADMKGDVTIMGNLNMVCSTYNEQAFPAIKRYQKRSTVITEFCGYNGEVLWSHNSEGAGVETTMDVSTDGNFYENGKALSKKYNPLITADTYTGFEEQSVKSGAKTSLGSFSITAGTWLIISYASFAANAAGTRYIVCDSTSGTNASKHRNTTTACAAATSGVTVLQHVRTISAASTTTLYLTAYQDSGTALNVIGGYSLVKLL